MTSRKKIVLIVTLIIIAFIATLYATSSFILMGGYARLENENLQRSVTRVLDALNDEGHKIDANVRDWAWWNDSYRYVIDKNPDFYRSNLVDPSLAGLHINLVAFVNASHQLVYGTGFDEKTGVRTPLPASFLYHLSSQSPLLNFDSLHGKRTGLIVLPEGVLLVDARPILNSEGMGPRRGTLLMGRFLDPKRVDNWGALTGLSVSALAYEDPSLPDDFQEAKSGLTSAGAVVRRYPEAHTIAGYTSVPDLYGHPGIILRIKSPRGIYEQGIRSLRYLALCVFGVLLVAGGVVFLLLKRWFSERSSHEAIEKRYRLVIQQASEAILLVDSETQIVLEANPAAMDLLGKPAAEIVNQPLENVAPFERSLIRKAFNIVRKRKEFSFGDYHYSRPDGLFVDVEISGRTLIHEEKEVICVVARDISDRKRAEAALRNSEERYALASQGANDGLWDWNLKTNEVYYSPRWVEMIGCKERELETAISAWFNRIHLKDYEGVMESINGHLHGNSPHFECEYRMRHQDGTYYWMLSRGVAVRDVEGKPYRMVGSQTDINTQKSVEQKLRREAFYDALTGLPNRILFVERLQELINLSKKQEDYLFAVLFLDLDRFKVINDGLGHLVGDQLLMSIAEKLQICVRPCDTVARFGGDEFTVLLREIKDVGDVTRIAERIQMELNTPLLLNGIEVSTSASIGIALSSSGYDRPEDLLRDADTTMYRAKAMGRARHEMFDADLHDNAVSLLELESDLRKAVERGEFQIHYQPILSVETGRIIGCEALTYWHHPERGLVSPGLFIPLAEETGLIEAMGEWVLRMACAQARIWQVAFQHDLKIYVNVSTRQFQRQNFPYLIQEVLRETEIAPESLELEITESVAMKDIDYSFKVMTHLNTLGVNIAIDDFGTGYSSLSYLKHFPIQALKIDRSFVNDITPDWDNVAIPDMIIAMAHSLKLKVVAEGVETEAQLDFVRSQGCDEMQGFLFSKPLSVEKFTEMLRKQGPLAIESGRTDTMTLPKLTDPFS